MGHRMKGSDINFDRQELAISNGTWKVNLNYESWNVKSENSIPPESIILSLSSEGEWSSVLKLSIQNDEGSKVCYLSGIHGGTYLHSATDDENYQSVKVEGSNLILSLGLSFVSLNLESLTLNWNIQPDLSEIFEFYDLDKDYLVRGELSIHRINKDGQIIWSYSGRDIWGEYRKVNLK